MKKKNVIGKLKGIIYEDDGVEYIHQFREGCAPTLCQGIDGKLLIRGGNYTILETGIHDTPRGLTLTGKMKG